MINYYVDPESGFIFVQGTSILWAVILGFLGGSLFLFKIFLKFFKRFLWIFFILLLVFIIGGLIMMHRPINKGKVIILGIDAMDPNIAEQLIKEGKLPNLSHLMRIGSYAHLATTIPAESVVAWTSFSTGLNPGGHGIFDFIMRDPKNYIPYLSLNEIYASHGKIKIQTRRKGDALWNILSRNKVPSFFYFCPNTFPAERILGKMLSGMGVPDISGTMGKFFFYTSKALSADDKDSRGKIIQVINDRDVIKTELYGPKIVLHGSGVESKIPLRINLLPSEESIEVHFQNNSFLLKKGNWSNWQRLTFNIGLFKKMHGITRFYLKSLKPEFQLYVSPINFDPTRPYFPISYPYNYSKTLTKKLSLYSTLGMPHDTWALTENRLDEKAFLEQVNEILSEKERILEEELKDFRGGLFFFYFDTLDIIQHMFWRYIDPAHPLYEKDSPYRDVIFKYYEKLDQIIGKVLKNLDGESPLIILSDHGFNSFRRAVHINCWLLENGYLSLKGGKNESREFLEDIDWSKTKAYALGFGGVYLNKIGREYYGIVSESEAEALKKEITGKLKNLQDPNTGELVVRNVYAQQEVFQGPYADNAPDLFIGFNGGFRASWQTALGGVPDVLIEDNRKKWSGEHLIDPTLVPGVLFINRKMNLNNPSIVDIAAIILDLLDVINPKQIHGK